MNYLNSKDSGVYSHLSTILEHEQKRHDEIQSYKLSNNIKNDLTTYIVYVHTLNNNIFNLIIKMFTDLYNAFDILISNSVMCNKNNINNVNNTYTYTINDEKLRYEYETLKNYTNSYNIYIVTELINIIFSKNRDLYSSNVNSYLASINNLTFHLNNKANIVQIIHNLMDIVKSYDISDNLLNIFNPIYNECIKIYSFTHKALTDTSNNSSHHINQNIKSLIFEKLQQSRLLFHDIKKEIDIFIDAVPKIKTLTEKYLDTANKWMDLYNS